MNASHPQFRRRQSSGVALIIVLAFVVLLTGLVVAFFSSSLLYRQISNTSANSAKVDLLTQGAVDTIVGDLKQEITAGSTVTSTTGGNIYSPRQSATAVVNPVGTNAIYPTLLKRSAYDYTNSVPLPFYANPASASPTPYDTLNFPPSKRAAKVSTLTPSLNGRFITPARWNKHLLLPKASYVTNGASDNNTTDFTPTASPAPATSTSWSYAPDWVIVARDGTNPSTWSTGLRSDRSSTGAAVGRYAYAIYDEGSLLDVNVAGYPISGSPGATPPLYTSSDSDIKSVYKYNASFADLSQLPGISTLSASTTQQLILNDLVGWRNFATVQPIGTLLGNFVFNATSRTKFTTAVIANTAGFMRPINAALYRSQSDRVFTSRQALLSFLGKGIYNNTTSAPLDATSQANLQAAMPYLGTFSRDLNQPSYSPNPNRPTIVSLVNGGNDNYQKDNPPNPANSVNPPFLTVRVTTSFTRNDGSTAAIGEPLVKKRFALNRLAWLTYQGASATRNLAPAATPTGADYDVWMLENTYGVPSTFLSQGTAANVYRYFGLSRVSDTRVDINSNPMDSNSPPAAKWVYCHTLANPAIGATASPITTLGNITQSPIKTLSQVAALGREPDFVELLKASICAGSVAKAQTAPQASGKPTDYQTYYQNAKDVSSDAAIIQIAANIIDQSDTDNCPTCILFDDGTWSIPQEFRGVEDLPYFYRVRSMFYAVRDSTPSEAYVPPISADQDYIAATPASPGPPPVPAQGAFGPNAGDIYNNQDPTATALSDSGLAVMFQVPEIWNPHAWNATYASSYTSFGPRPTQFRIFAIDATPNIAKPPTADPNKMTPAGYVRAGSSSIGQRSSTAGVGVLPTTMIHALSYTPDGTALYFSIPYDNTSATTLGKAASTRLDLFREPTPLFRPGVPSGSQLHFGGDPAAGSVEPNKNQVFNTSLESASPPGESQLKNYLKVSINGYTGVQTVTPSSVHFDYPSGGVWGPSPTSTPAGSGNLNDDSVYLGIYQGTFPLRWLDSGNGYSSLDFTANSANLLGGGDTYPMTYRIQYKDPATSNWITYDEKYSGVMGEPGRGENDGTFKNPYYLTWKFAPNNSDGCNLTWIDPRTPRFGGFDSHYNPYAGGDLSFSWSSVPAGSTGSSQIGGARQANFLSVRGAEAGTMNYAQYFIPGVGGWYPNTSTGANLYYGLLSQNNPAMTSPQTEYFQDPDSVVRRGMAAYLQPGNSQAAVNHPTGSPTAGPTGLPTAVMMDYTNASSTTAAVQVANSTNNDLTSRAMVLNRPFRSVADLDYVYSGTPWRNLDLTTPESGNSALLDVFCVNDTDNPNGLVAGKLNVNSGQWQVIQALLAQAYQDEFNSGTVGLAPTGSATAATATTIAKNLVLRTAGNTATSTAGVPFANLGELVGKWNTTVNSATGSGVDGSQSYVGFSGAQTPAAAGNSPTTATIPGLPNLSTILNTDTTSFTNVGYANANIQRLRGATIRALANGTQARVWNVMIDVIAQAGRYPATAAGLNQFLVEGEQRYWVHLAIDRMTGQVIDKQVEIVKE